MTLRSAADRTYQVVGSESPAIESTLARLSAGSEVTVRLVRAHGRGDGWYVAAVAAPESARPPTDAAIQGTDRGPADHTRPSSRRESR